jgi:small subunit ribosomal protein S13
MILIFGVTLDKDKKVVHALPQLYGIGKAAALSLCKELGFSLNLKVSQLSEDQQYALSKKTKEDYRLEDALREMVKSDIKRYMSNGSLRGFRHRNRLPVRGQRTRTNAKTPRRQSLGLK